MRASLASFLWVGVVATFASLSPTAWAFPEMTRHGYQNCTSCHLAPTGGGALTPYGRQLAKELLSFSPGFDGEERVAYAIEGPEWLRLGGDVRAIQTFKSNSQLLQLRALVMQADIEAGADSGKWFGAATLGRRQVTSPATIWDSAISRRHYVGHRAGDEVSVRAGRFYPAYGLGIVDHVFWIKSDLGWDQEKETYNLEGAWLGESRSAIATLSAGREIGVAFTGSTVALDGWKVGANYYYGWSGTTGARHLAGLWGILGFSERLYLLAEADAVVLGQSGQFGVVDFAKLGFEIVQGLHVFGVQQLSLLNAASPATTLKLGFGGGIQFFPRPHWEIQLYYEHQLNRAVSAVFGNYGWLLAHFYI